MRRLPPSAKHGQLEQLEVHHKLQIQPVQALSRQEGTCRSPSALSCKLLGPRLPSQQAGACLQGNTVHRLRQRPSTVAVLRTVPVQLGQHSARLVLHPVGRPACLFQTQLRDNR